MDTLFTDWIALYQDPMFLKFPVAAMVLSVGAFLVTALPWTLLAWIDPPWAKRYKIQDKPFDYAILEKSKNINGIKLHIPWSDLGSWKEISNIFEK